MKAFLREAFCENGKVSMKRVSGLLGWVVCQLCVFLATIVELYLTKGLSTVSALIITDMTLSCGLIGLATIMNRVNGNTTSIGKAAENAASNTASESNE